MNIPSIQNVLSTSLAYFEDRIIKPLTAQQKKVAFIALAIFTAIATGYVVYQRYFKATKLDDSEDPKVPTPSKPAPQPTPSKKDPQPTPKKTDGEDPSDTPSKGAPTPSSTPVKSPHSSKKTDPVESKENDPIDPADDEVDPKLAEVLADVTKAGANLENHPEYQGDREVVEKACGNDGWAIQFAPDFQDDDKMADLATTTTPSSIQFFSDKIRGQETRMIALAKINGNLGQYATEDLRKTSEQLAEVSVSGDPMSLEFFPAFNDNDKIVGIAFDKNPKSIKYASDRLQKTKVDATIT